MKQHAAAAAAKSLQSCPTLCNPIDGSLPGSSIPGILQASTLDWVAISFSNAWKWKVKVKSLSHVRLFATPWTAAYQAPPSMGFSKQEYWSGVPLPSLLQSTGSVIVAHGLLALKHVGSPQIRDQTCVSCIGRQILYHWATREALLFIFLKGFEQRRIQYRIGAKVNRVQALVDWSHEGQKHQHPSGTSWSGGWALVRGVEFHKAAQESASG